MEDWQKELISTIETLQVEASIFIQELTETLEEVSQDFQTTFLTDLEALWQELFEFIDSNGDYPENSEFVNDFLNPKVEPSKENYPACLGCSHYHGRVYGQQILVCAMHPYGWTDETCPDWQKDSETP